MIKKFNDYITEGIRDKMVPKSEEEIKNVIDNLIVELKNKDSDLSFYDVLKKIQFLKGINTDKGLFEFLINSELISYDEVNEMWIDIIDDNFADELIDNLDNLPIREKLIKSIEK